MMPLNDKFAKAKVKEVWGEIRHPTLEDLVLMILRASDRWGKDGVELWKMDLANAFGLLDIAPQSVHLLANALTNNVSMLYTVGMFGWVGTPYAFDVITRSLRWRMRESIRGEGDMYVDDLMGCSSISDVQEDMATTKRVVEELMGDNSISDKKSVRGRRVDLLGWAVDLDKGIVTIAQHNFMKAFYGFFTAEVDGAIPFHTMERLASWASRYSQLSRSMKPFVNVLHQSMTHRRNKNAAITITD
jgi:hypothetical protein